jgi:hypothetical protein
MAVRNYRLEWDSGLVFSAVMDGAGTGGDSIGITATRGITAAGMTRGAEPTTAVRIGEADLAGGSTEQASNAGFGGRGESTTVRSQRVAVQWDQRAREYAQPRGRADRVGGLQRLRPADSEKLFSRGRALAEAAHGGGCGRGRVVAGTRRCGRNFADFVGLLGGLEI